ncbi:DUF5131 family protein [Nocardia brasiliensis]|uniref:DUF5131 family protein n=1 Tax=Nocardia brasiliensis TaxID=37326 RepID=UPI0037A4079A
MTAIEWAEETWNPVSGCTRVSEGCTNCYIERTPPMRMAHRRFDGTQIGATTGVQLHPERLAAPLRWRRPRRVFVNSMSDLFHESIPDGFIGSVFDTMALAEQHTFQILTKRPGRARSLLNRWQEAAADRSHAGASFRRYDGLWSEPPVWPLPNVWLGVSVESQKWADIRIPQLLDTPAAVRWISAEPLLGPVDLAAWLPGACTCTTIPLPQPMHYDGCPALKWRGLDWVVAGGETGPGARPMHPDWARSLRDQCTAAGASFFFKQWGDWTGEHREGDQWAWTPPDTWVSYETGTTTTEADATAAGGSWQAVWRVGKKRAGRELDGRTWDEYPVITCR